MARIIGFFGARVPLGRGRDWSNQDIAEFYRVETALLQAGLRIDTERGESDEGDPWFVFCHADTGEVIVHFARIDNQYVVAAPALSKVLRAPELETIVRSFIADNPVSLPQPDKREANVIFHPAALLTIFVATLLLSFRPDESFAAAELDRPDWLTDDSPEDGAFAHLMSGKSFAGGTPIHPLGGEGQDSRAAENALLVAVVAMALEVAKFQGQDAGSDATQITMLDSLLSRTGQDDSGQGEPGRPGSFAGSAETDDGGLNQGTHKQAGAASEVETPQIALIEMVAPKPDNLVDLALVQVEVDVSTADEVDDKLLKALGPSDEIVLEDHLLSGLDRTLFVEAGSSNVVSEFEEIAISFGLKTVTLDAAVFAEIDRVVEFVEGGGAELTIDSTSPVEGVAFSWTTLLDGLNDDIFQAIGHFVNSDVDIAMARHDSGLVLLFDTSDIQDRQKPLQMHIWALDDDSKIAILGHSDTILDALALTA